MAKRVQLESQVINERAFEKALLEAIDETLRGLGDSAADAIYFHLENEFSLKRDEIPDRLVEFDNCLKKIFGPGSSVFENLIIKHLYEKLGLKFKETKEQEKQLFTGRPSLAKAKFVTRFGPFLSEIERNIGLLSSLDLIKELGRSLQIDSLELLNARDTLLSTLDEYSKRKFKASMERKTREFLVNELVYSMLMFKTEGEYEQLVTT